MNKEMILSGSEVSQLTQHEQTIESGLQTFFEVGAALRAIRDGRLYRLMHSSFEEYCRERWEFSKRYANYQIGAAEVRESLGTIVPILPATESQCRPLIGLADGDLQEVWQTVVEKAEANGGKITAKLVQECREAVVKDEEEEDDAVIEDEDMDERLFAALKRATRHEKVTASQLAEWSGFARTHITSMLGGVHRLRGFDCERIAKGEYVIRKPESPQEAIMGQFSQLSTKAKRMLLMKLHADPAVSEASTRDQKKESKGGKKNTMEFVLDAVGGIDEKLDAIHGLSRGRTGNWITKAKNNGHADGVEEITRMLKLIAHNSQRLIREYEGK